MSQPWPLAAPLLVSAFTLLTIACATPYVVTLRDGRTIETKNEPKFDEKTEFYELTTTTGRKMKINRDELVSMESK